MIWTPWARTGSSTSSPGTTPVDITAIRETTSAGDPRMSIVDESSIVTVTDDTHGCVLNDFVTFSGATGTEGGIAASVINAEHQVRSVIDANNYTFDCGQAANATVGSNAWGTAIVAKYQTNVGLSSQVSGSGWGAGLWGGATTVGWGDAAAIAIETGQLRNIAVDNYGEDLIYCNRGGPLYYWDFDESSSSGIPNERAKEMNIANYPEADGGYDLPLTVLDFMVSERDGHVIAFGVNDIGATSTNALLVRWSDQNNPFDWEPKGFKHCGGSSASGWLPDRGGCGDSGRDPDLDGFELAVDAIYWTAKHLWIQYDLEERKDFVWEFCHRCCECGVLHGHGRILRISWGSVATPLDG